MCCTPVRVGPPSNPLCWFVPEQQDGTDPHLNLLTRFDVSIQFCRCTVLVHAVLVLTLIFLTPFRENYIRDRVVTSFSKKTRVLFPLQLHQVTSQHGIINHCGHLDSNCWTQWKMSSNEHDIVMVKRYHCEVLLTLSEGHARQFGTDVIQLHITFKSPVCLQINNRNTPNRLMAVLILQWCFR